MSPINNSLPRLSLLCEAGLAGLGRRWRFVVQGDDGQTLFEASDEEPDIVGDRLDLLTLVRGLEALDEPANVTVFTNSVYVRQGIHFGLSEWRDSGWQWEWFGQMVPVKNADLWQRLDHILRFHRVSCHQRRLDAAHGAARPHETPYKMDSASPARSIGPLANRLEWGIRWLPSAWLAWLRQTACRLRHWLNARGETLMACAARLL